MIPPAILQTIKALILDAGVDLWNAISPEIHPLIEEALGQRQTPDGWTKRERYTYAIGVCRRVKAKQIGNWIIDRGADWLLDAAEDFFQNKLDELDNDVPVPVPPSGPKYEQILLVKPTEPVTAGDRLWTKKLPTGASIWMILPSHQIGYPGWLETSW